MNPTLRQTTQTKNLIVGLNPEFIYKVENISTDISLLSQPSELYKVLLPVIHLYLGIEWGTVITREGYMEFIENLHDIGYETFIFDGRYDGVSILKDSKSLTLGNEGLKKMKENLIMAWDVRELSESLAMSLKEAIKKIFKEEMEKGEKGLLSSISDSGKEEALYQALTYLRASTPFL